MNKNLISVSLIVMKTKSHSLGVCIVLCLLSYQYLIAADEYVRVSQRDFRYLELSDGKPYIPIGLNLIHPDTRPEDGLARMEEWLKKLSSNGGNYIRVWLSSDFWDVEHTKCGVYDEEKAKRIDELLNMAKRYGIKVKLTLEHFRTIDGEPRQKWAHKPIHHISMGGTATNLADFFAGEKSREQFKRKLNWYKSRYGNNPTIYGWELWNEINAVATRDVYYIPWTEIMLAELHRLFPKNMAMQSLGSFDREGSRNLYRRMSLMPGNDIAQVHRYLDLGAELEICHKAVDELAADAVRELISYNPKRPVILAESGAVEPRHSGPFKLYAKDKAGIILHDILFAPFFSGSAGAGQIWHWDVYVDRNNLWHHFKIFAESVKGIDPSAEQFEPLMIPHTRLKVYCLKGKNTILIWCRDSQNNWMTELRDEIPPETLRNQTINLKPLSIKNPIKSQYYDLWNDKWGDLMIEDNKANLPEFSRSILIRISLK